MACNNICQTCRQYVVSSSVTVGADSLVVNIPDAVYADGARICLRIAQVIPDTATVNLPVVVTIGTNTTEFPLTNCDCVQLTASALAVNRTYTVKVVTNAVSGVFRILSSNVGRVNKLPFIPVTTTTTGG